jgi:c-di-GMP-binding flagellar brake protein YcgR
MDERRKFPRFKLSVEVKWQKASENGAPGTARTSNVSAGGVCLILTEGVQVGDVLEIDLTLAGGKRIRVKGRVAWTNPNVKIGEDRTVCECGVEFLDLSPAERREISELFFNLPKL